MSTALQNDRVDLATIPSVIPNQIGHLDAYASDSRTFSKVDPATGRPLCQVARSTAADVQRAVEAARSAQPAWAALTPVKRGDILRQIAMLMREHRAAIADLVARETGKSRKDALGETDAAIEMGFFVAGEGRRYWVFSEGSAGKVKRIRANGRARVADCDFRGRLLGDWIEGRARILRDPDQIARGYAALRRKYGWQMKVGDLASKLSGRYHRRALLELELEVGA